MGIKILLLALALFTSENKSEEVKLTKYSQGNKETTLSVGTIYSKESSIGKLLLNWKNKVSKKTNGEIKIKLYFDGDQGDEEAMVAKMRAGQLDGAALTDGLGMISKPISAVEMPGLYKDSVGLYRAMRRGLPVFRQQFAKEGMALIGITTTFNYLLSKGLPIKLPEELKSRKVRTDSDSYIDYTMAQTFGYTGVHVDENEILPSLQQGRINVLITSVSKAKNLQWISYLDHVMTTPVSVEIGGLVFLKNKIDGLSSEHREILISTFANLANKYSNALLKSDETWLTSSSRYYKTTLTDNEKGKWHKAFGLVRQNLGAKGIYPAAWISKLEKGL